MKTIKVGPESISHITWIKDWQVINYLVNDVRYCIDKYYSLVTYTYKTTDINNKFD